MGFRTKFVFRYSYITIYTLRKGLFVKQGGVINGK